MVASRLPNMKRTVLSWARKTKLYVITKTQVDYETVETTTLQGILCFRDPSGQKLKMMPDGQRAWNTETIFTDTRIKVKIDDQIAFNDDSGQRYRVMAITDFTDFGYFEIDILADYYA